MRKKPTKGLSSPIPDANPKDSSTKLKVDIYFDFKKGGKGLKMMLDEDDVGCHHLVKSIREYEGWSVKLIRLTM